MNTHAQRFGKRQFGLAALLAMTSGLSAEPAAPELPVDVELAEIEASFPGGSSAGKTAVTFQVQSKDDGWILYEPREAAQTRRAKEDGHPEVYRTYFMREEKDHSLRLIFNRNIAPEGSGITLEDHFVLVRSKKGRTLPAQTIELGKPGSFEAGGVRFEYDGHPGRIEVTRDDEKSVRSERRVEFESSPGVRTSYYSGELTITYPEDVALAALEVRDERGKLLDATPATRRKGKTSFSLPAADLKKVQLIMTLSDAEETIELPFKRTVAMGDVAAGQKKPMDTRYHRPYGTLSWMFAWSERSKAALTANGDAECAVDVALQGITLGNREISLVENRAELKFLLIPSDGYLIPGGKLNIPALDSEGNALTCFYDGDSFNVEKGGALWVSLSFDKLPKGEWIELDTSLPLAHAKKLRTLPARTVPLLGKGQGSFEAGGCEILYNAAVPEWVSKFRNAGKGSRIVSLSIAEEDKDRIASIALRDTRGNDVQDINDQGVLFQSLYSCAQAGKMRDARDYYLASSVGDEVQVVVTVREGIMRCVVPLKMRIGLEGIVASGHEKKTSTEKK